MESVIAKAIRRNNDAVDLLLEGQTSSIASDEVFRECMLLVKESLMLCHTYSTEEDAAKSSDSVCSCCWASQTYPLVQPSRKSLATTETTEFFCYPHPLYFSCPGFRDSATRLLVDPSLIQFVSAVVMFNMGLCFQYNSFISITTSETGTKKRSSCRSLGKAQIFYQSAAHLLRDVFPLGIATEVELFAWTNLLQVSVELVDAARGQEAATAIHLILTCVQQSAGVAAFPPFRPELVDQSLSYRIQGNLLWWQLMTTTLQQPSAGSSPSPLGRGSSRSNTKKALVVLATCAPAA